MSNNSQSIELEEGVTDNIVVAQSPSTTSITTSSGSSHQKKHKHKHHHHDHDHHHDHEHHHDEEDDSNDETQLIKSTSGLIELELDRVKLDGNTLRKIYLSKNKPVWKEPDFVKLIIMIVMVLLMFLAELNVGIIAESLTLLADSFHMLSDGISLIVGATCIWLAKKGPTKNMTYGFGRAETLGGLINAVFLVSVVLYVMMESIQRFFIPERINDPLMVLCVGGAGLLINLIGLVMFCGHHPHPGHDHDHGHGHDHGHSHGHNHSHDEHDHDHSEHDHDEHDHEHHEHDTHDHSHEKKEHKHRSENIFGVFLHILGDFLGSIAVMISSGILLIFNETKEDGQPVYTWILYIDPALSLIMSGIILFTAIPLLKSTCRTLLQSVPNHVDVPDLKSKILEVEGVLSCHELHVWQLVGQTSVASVHILTSENSKGFMKIAKQVQKIFHKFNIHASTIQPEFISSTVTNKNDDSQPCHLICTDTCYEHFCCAPNPGKDEISDPANIV